MPQNSLKKIPVRIPMTKVMLTLVTSLALGASACAPADGADEFRDGVPIHDDVTLALPGAGNQQSALTAGGTTATQGARLGDRAESDTLTRDITGMVNVATVAGLTPVNTNNPVPP